MTKSNNETSFLSSVFEALSYTSVCYGVIYRWYLTMQLVSIILQEWDRDVSEATERRGQPQRLGLSRLTKGSCNCLSRATDSTAAVNVTGYNGRSFSDRAEGPEVERSLWRWQLLVYRGLWGQPLHRHCLVSARVSCCLCPLVSAVRVGTNKVTAATTVWKNSAAHRSVFI